MQTSSFSIYNSSILTQLFIMFLQVSSCLIRLVGLSVAFRLVCSTVLRQYRDKHWSILADLFWLIYFGVQMIVSGWLSYCHATFEVRIFCWILRFTTVLRPIWVGFDEQVRRDLWEAWTVSDKCWIFHWKWWTFVLKMVNYALKMMNFCIKNGEFFIENDELLY